MQPSLLGPTTLTVSELTYYLRQLLESDEILKSVWVQGEISNLSQPSSGHIYFTLKDSSAALRCVIWRTAAMRIKTPLQNGNAIDAYGAISIYEAGGNYQLYVSAVRLAGEGALYQEFMRLKARLEAEGLFDPEHKRPLPDRVQRIGIVTSPTGAALQDMLNTLRHRYPLAQVFLAGCAVQGSEAPLEIVNAIQRLNQIVQPDVILVARGGGSLEDLWAFNDERVVRAIYASTAVVVTGIGHETDFTLADFVADLRAPTPTGAAVLATPDIADLINELANLSGRLLEDMLVHILSRRQNVDALHQSLEQQSPLWLVQNGRQRLDEQQRRSQRSMRHMLQLRQAHVQALYSQLNSLNPLAVLKRGFAVVTRSDGSLVKNAASLQQEDLLNIRLAHGSFTARVNQVSQADED